jgi:hypothetical protein
LAADFAPTRIDLGDVFNRTWAIFKVEWGMCLVVLIVVWLISMGVNIVVSIVTGIGGAVAGEPVVALMFSIMGNLLTMLFSVWIGIGQALYFLKIARGQQATLADIFSGGPYFVSILLATILFFLIIAAVAGICLGPAGLLLLAGADSEVALMVFIPGLIVVLVVNVILSLMFSQY